MKILVYPHPALKRKAQPVKQFGKKLEKFVRQMFETMYKADGVGLAGPQVDVPYAVAVVNITRKPSNELVLINPKIVKSSGALVCDEGCLSFPSFSAKVKRSRHIACEAFDTKGKQITFAADDLLARAIQHEIDHLNGILLVDRMEKA
jgi:peptide deformylase